MGRSGNGGQALIRSHASGSVMLGGGRQIVRRSAGATASYWVRPSPRKGASVGEGAEVRVDLAGDVTLQAADDLHL